MRRWFPALEWIPKYGRRDWMKDLPAGLTVGVMLIPQGMAYAMIAGLPVVYGLYAALVPQVIYAAMGTSRQLAVGPVAMDSLLVAAGLGTVAVAGSDRYIELALLLALMMGSLQLLLGTFRLGFLAHFISKPVISGFTSAAALIIGLNQLPLLTGIALPRSSQLHRLVESTVDGLAQFHGPTVLLGTVSIALLVGLRKGLPRVPGSLVLVVLALAGGAVVPWG
ncbi:MAG: SulP family inorganic anion transporter, partial [Bacteroidota bacterium]|nr:SulP family inorganic anion transporter [Bacteroidota bacterium]